MDAVPENDFSEPVTGIQKSYIAFPVFHGIFHVFPFSLITDQKFQVFFDLGRTENAGRNEFFQKPVPLNVDMLPER